MRRRTWLALAGLAAALLAPAAAQADIFAAVQVGAPRRARTSTSRCSTPRPGRAWRCRPAPTRRPTRRTRRSRSTAGGWPSSARTPPPARCGSSPSTSPRRRARTSSTASRWRSARPATRPSMPTSNIVYTGGPFVAQLGLRSRSRSSRPRCPTSRRARSRARRSEPQYTFLANGSLQDLAVGGALIAFQETRAGFNGELVLRQLGGTASLPAGRTSNSDLREPAHGGRPPEHRGLRSASVDLPALQHRRHRLPPGDDVELRRAPDRAAGDRQLAGRRVAARADGRRPLPRLRPPRSDGHDRLFVWDSQTQTLLNGTASTSAPMTSRDVGSRLALHEAHPGQRRASAPAA